MTYQLLRAMSSLVPAASFFAAVYVGTRAKLEILALHVLKAAKRIFGIPDFQYYALANRIKEVLSKAGKGIPGAETMPSPHIRQFPLFST